jgi:hypothetical protein
VRIDGRGGRGLGFRVGQRKLNNTNTTQTIVRIQKGKYMVHSKCLAIYSWDLSLRIGSEKKKTFLRTKVVFSFFLSFFLSNL